MVSSTPTNLGPSNLSASPNDDPELPAAQHTPAVAPQPSSSASIASLAQQKNETARQRPRPAHAPPSHQQHHDRLPAAPSPSSNADGQFETEAAVEEVVSKRPKQQSQDHPPRDPFTGRVLSSVSPQLASYKAIGFTVDPANPKRLAVTDRVRFNQWCENVRKHDEAIPAEWSTRVKEAFGRVIHCRPLKDYAAVRALAADEAWAKGEADDRVVAAKSRVPPALLREGFAGLMTETIESLYERRERNVEHRRLSQRASGAVGGSLEDLDDVSSLVQDVDLNAEQKCILELAKRGFNLYIGGDAGTGKTVVLREVRRALTNLRLVVASTATTGLAACHINGCTFHHALKLNRLEVFTSKDMDKFDVVIIDEISMLAGHLFDDFDRAMREARHCDLPFGGAQVIVCGDFLQLEAVIAPRKPKYAVFQSQVFRESFVSTRLVAQMRQGDFPRFAAQLRMLRHGTIPDDLLKTVRVIARAEDDDRRMVRAGGDSDNDANRQVRLLARNRDARKANLEALEKLPGEAMSMPSTTESPKLTGAWTKTVLLKVSPDFNPDVLRAELFRRMAIRSRRKALILYPIYEDGYALRLMLPESSAELSAEYERAFMEAVPQIATMGVGATVRAVTDGDGLFTRAHEETLERLMQDHPIAATPCELKVGAQVLLRANLTNDLVNGSVGTVTEFVPVDEKRVAHDILCRYSGTCDTYATALRARGHELPVMPVVEFRTGRKVAIPPIPFSVGGDILTQYYEMSSYAIPLTLAFALTIHKTQGLTLLAPVRVELENAWRCESLAYVAMSRVRSPEQLTVSGFEPDKILANPRAVDFDQSLPPPSKALDAIDAERIPRAGWYVSQNSTMIRTSYAPADAPAATKPVVANNKRAGGGEKKNSPTAGVPTEIPASLVSMIKSTNAGQKRIKAAPAAPKKQQQPSNGGLPLFLSTKKKN